MNWKDHIVATPDTLVGKPRIKDTRISVQLILACLASGWSFEQVIDAYPRITREDILAALAFAAELLDEEQGIAANKVSRVYDVLQLKSWLGQDEGQSIE